MDELERRVFLKVAGMGMFAFTVGGASVMMTPGEARLPRGCGQKPATRC